MVPIDLENNSYRCMFCSTSLTLAMSFYITSPDIESHDEKSIEEIKSLHQVHHLFMLVNPMVEEDL